jgi:hypothetical protein
MTEQRHFETTTEYRARSPRTRNRSGNREEQDAQRGQKEIENLQATISDLERCVLVLQLDMAAEHTIARARDPSHFGCPIAVRTMTVRRNNLNVTLTTLSKRLSELTEPTVRSTCQINPGLGCRSLFSGSCKCFDQAVAEQAVNVLSIGRSFSNAYFAET